MTDSQRRRRARRGGVGQVMTDHDRDALFDVERDTAQDERLTLRR